jgi:hypothetical protein
MKKKILNSNDAYNLLDELNAPPKLITHVKLVLEAAEVIIEECIRYTSSIDYEFIRIGVILHDVGKIIYPDEFIKSGELHESEGERLLLNIGVNPKIARCCLSHSNYNTMECSIEETIIALADNLWKGKRIESLESKVIEWFYNFFDKEIWEVYLKLNETFEIVAAKGLERLIRS